MDLVNHVGSREWITYKGFSEVFRYVLLPGAGGEPNLQIGTGLGGAFFAVCGVLLDWRRSLGLLGILVAAVIFGLGPVSPVPVVAMMSAVPVFNMMGSYGMYASVVILFCICGIAAIGFERLRGLVAFANKQPKGTTGPETDKLVITFAVGLSPI